MLGRLPQHMKRTEVCVVNGVSSTLAVHGQGMLPMLRSFILTMTRLDNPIVLESVTGVLFHVE